MPAEKIELHLVVPESGRAAAVDDIEQAGGQVEVSDAPFKGDDIQKNEPAFEPLLIIISVVSIAYVVRLAQRMWRDTKDAGGQIIDVRDGKCMLRTVDSLDRGTIILVTDQGTTVHRPQESDDVKQLLTASNIGG
jgi:hypothetical protein